ncbi:hypothetical protein NONI108955_06415 [Nocardia ninae]|uniref:Uncharacterized protein n=1 Tax=Nocardia ninae NBRC 108245 TaxID=1210091 RepID=A0A511ME87_9NOCA|nr:hypothetical protein [Nocardia ninae]GEM38899.1 hypothetical protein NN4_34180 [Nocardia ninae NBRC 108245]
MALQLRIYPAPPLRLTPDCTIHTGIVQLAMTGRFLQSLRGQPDEFGVFLPDAAPLLDGATEPNLWAEAFVASTVSAPASGFPSGVDHVRATYLADPREGGTTRRLHLGGAAHIAKGITLSYRVTVQTA